MRLIETKVDRKIHLILRTFHNRSYYFTKIIACAVSVDILVGHQNLLQKCVAVFFFYNIPFLCNVSLDHHVLRADLVEYKTGKREYTRVGWDTAKLTLPYLAKTPRIYNEARMNNSRFSVYRGDFRKSIKACEFTHVGVFMRTRRVDSRFAASRIVPIC